MAVDENTWKERLGGSDKKPSAESNTNADKVLSTTGTKLLVKVGKDKIPESGDLIFGNKEPAMKMEIDVPMMEGGIKKKQGEEVIPHLISPKIPTSEKILENMRISPSRFATSNVLQKSTPSNKPMVMENISAQQPAAARTPPSLPQSEILLDMANEGRHPAVYTERNQLPIFSRVNIQNPIHLTTLNSRQTSIQEKKLYAMAPAIFFDRHTSDDEYFYLYYMSDTGVITRMRGDYASRRLLDEHSVHFPFSVNHQSIQILDSIDRMPPSCRFLDNGRVIYSDGLGKLTCYLADREFPFKWIHQMSFYLPLNSDNVCVLFDVHHILPQRPGLPCIIADARIRENITEIALIASVRRKPEKIGNNENETIIFSKIYWLSIGKKEGEAMTRIIRQRIFECNEIVDYVSFDPNCFHLIFASTCKPNLIFDSNRPTISAARPLVRHIPDGYPFKFEQTNAAITVTIQFTFFLTENFLEVIFDKEFLCVKYRATTLFRAPLFAAIIPFNCDYQRESLFGHNRATTNLVINLVKAVSGEWDHLLAKEVLNIEPTSYYDHHFINSSTTIEKETPKKEGAIISWVHSGSGEITQFTKINEPIICGGIPIHHNLCISKKDDAKLLLFSNDKAYKDYATIEDYNKIKNSIQNIRFSGIAPSGRYFVHVDDKNKIYLYSWKRQIETNDTQNVVGEKFIFDLGRYVEKYSEYSEQDKEIICVMTLEKVLILATRNAFYITSDV